MADGDPSDSPLTEDAALRAIVEGAEAEIGDHFFSSLVRHLASALGVAYAFVSEITDDRRHFRTLAVWARGALRDNFTIPLAGTPCEAVLNGQMSHYPDRLQERFPLDVGLVDWNAHSYCGVPLIARSGEVVGHLAIIDDAPMPDGPRGLSILRIFAARARAEIDRKRADAALRLSEERLARILGSTMDAIVTIDETNRIELFNAAAEKVFGCPAGAAVGQSFDAFMTPGFRRALDAARRARGDNAPPFVWAPDGLNARRANGEEFAIEATASQVDVAGRRLCTLVLRDVDERRRFERALHTLQGQNEYLQEEIKAVHNFEEIVGQSDALTNVLRQIELVASTDASVLILGETGTGKELVARAVHSHSPRRDRPLIKVNCAGLPSGLIESELFGHERGAFTGATERRIGRFELAAGGTIFLDEVGEVPLETQVKLLRVLQEQEFERVGGSTTIRADVRLIAATHRDIERAVAAGEFREDLFYRLNVFPVRLPPLRERRDDIPLLVHYFTARHAAKVGRAITRVPQEVMDRLRAYAWPGNVRELENVIERAVILSPAEDLEVAAGVLPDTAAAAPLASTPSSPPTLQEVERRHIVRVLQQTQWRIDGAQGAARLLDLNPSTLRSRMQKLGIRRDSAGGA